MDISPNPHRHQSESADQAPDAVDARARIASGVPKAAIARDLGVSRSTLYRALDNTPAEG